MHGRSEPRKMSLPLQAMRKQQERKYSSPMMTFNSELSVEPLPTLKPLTTTLGISQHYGSDSHDRHGEIGMAVILTGTHKVYQNIVSYRHITQLYSCKYL